MRRFDPSRHLTSPEAIAAYLDEIMQMNDPDMLLVGLQTVAKAQGMTELARRAGVGRESLYKSLSSGANPSLKTIIKVLQALNVHINFEPNTEPQPATQQATKQLVYA
ncbi:addiction module antidote protein [Alloscardovia criceti]|uniref:addiction module antidote protein n=1 Tax=Alloscardovia criceti TaxID=356828 RepID=UPI001FDF4E63|nr:addiction module antidote protein [Alloscardovia criceti]